MFQNGTRLSSLSSDTRRAVGEAVIFAVLVLYGLYAVWPRSHFLALFGLVIGASGLLFSLPTRAWAIATGFAAALAAIIYASTAPNEAFTGEAADVLHTANDPIPSIVCNTAPPDAIYVLLGPTVIFHAPTEASMTLISRRDGPVLTAERTRDGLAIDSRVYNTDGTLIGTIEKNSFRPLASGNAYSRRGDSSTLGIYDERGDELLYVRYLNLHAIRVRGTFMGSTRIIISENKVGIGSSITDGTRTCTNSQSGFLLP